MPRFPIYHSIKRVILVLPFIFFFPEINAQRNDQPDTTRIITDDTVDSLQTTTFDERGLQDFPDSGVTESPGYFLDRKLQVSGGGPDTLEVRKLPDSVLKKMQADEHFWYANHQFKKEKKKEEESSFMDSTAFQTLLWLIIVGGFAAFVVIYLSNSNVGLFRKGGKTIASNTEGEVETDNIFEINYQRKLTKP